MKYSFLLLFVTTIMVGCNKKNTFKIEAPILELEPQFVEIVIDTQKDSIYELVNGVRLSIHKNSLLDANSDVIKGAVQLKFRLFENAVGIFLAGMPMDFNLDKNMALQTAGMFEIRGTFNNVSVHVDKNKPISVTIGSNYTDTRQGFFKLDEKNGQWNLIDIPEWKENEELKALKEKLKCLKPKWQIPLPPNFYVFSHLRMADIFVGDDNWLAIQDMNKNAMKRKMEKYGVDELELDLGWQSVKYKGNLYGYGELLWKADTKLILPKWAKEVNDYCYDNGSEEYKQQIELEQLKNNSYKFTLNDFSKGKTVSFTLKMVCHLRHLLKYTPEQLIAENKKIQQEIEEAEERIKKMKLIEYTIDVYDMGIYNYDRPILYREGRPELALKIDNVLVNSEEIHKIAIFNEDLSSVSYPTSYNPIVCPMFKGSNKMVLIKKNGEIALLSGNEFNQILSQNPWIGTSFVADLSSIMVSSEQELKELLNN